MFGIAVPRVDTKPMRRAVGELDTPEREQLAGAFVLIVDDDDENREALGALCDQWGCHVLVAHSIEHALAELAHHLRTPDLIWLLPSRKSRSGSSAIGSRRVGPCEIFTRICLGCAS